MAYDYKVSSPQRRKLKKKKSADGPHRNDNGGVEFELDEFDNGFNIVGNKYLEKNKNKPEKSKDTKFIPED